MNKRELSALIKACEAQGFEVKRTTNQHLRVTKGGRPVVTFSGTPSDWRAIKNAMAQLRRAGFQE
jgi:hypothetical protein